MKKKKENKKKKKNFTKTQFEYFFSFFFLQITECKKKEIESEHGRNGVMRENGVLRDFKTHARAVPLLPRLSSSNAL